MIAGGYPKYVLDLSRKYGEAAYQLIFQMLSVHANLNCRRALGFLSVMETIFERGLLFNIVCEKAKSANIVDPKIFKNWMENEESKSHQDELFQMSEERNGNDP